MDIVTRTNQNNRKIPEAIFIENVDELIKKHTIQKLMEGLQEAYKQIIQLLLFKLISKYKFMEAQLIKQKDSMQNKIPEIKKAIDIVSYLELPAEEDHTIDFLITDTIWSKATVPKDTKTVCLWLGANTMVEFYFDEAKGLLNSNLENAKQNLKSFEEDISYLKDQITTIEVDIARVYNANVKIQQQQQQPKQ